MGIRTAILFSSLHGPDVPQIEGTASFGRPRRTHAEADAPRIDAEADAPWAHGICFAFRVRRQQELSDHLAYITKYVTTRQCPQKT